MATTNMDQREGTTYDSSSVRNDLERIRQETQREIDRLNRELLEHLDAANRSVDSATDLLALEQESEQLRLALREREESLDGITAECRRLEDQLEDQNLAYDGLKQELDRKHQALDDARARAEQLAAELERIRAAAHSGWIKPFPDSPGQAAGPGSTSQPGKPRRSSWTVPLGLVAAAAAALLWWQLNEPPRQPQRGVATPPVDVAKPDLPEPVGAGEPHGDTATEDAVGRTPDSVLGTLRDPLRSGGSGPLMVHLQGGRYTMGRDTPDAPDAGPAHEVDVPPFLIGATEVTFADYDHFVRATGRRAPRDYGWGRGQRPVIDVSWHDARAYAQWLSRQTGEAYRLPSEAEWELAARGGADSSYWWGGYPETGRAACFDCGSRWDNRSTAPVASFAANPFRLYDTAGNAAEWVADCYRPSYSGAPTDGSAREARGCDYRVIRGGAFSRPASSMRSFARNRLAPTVRLNMVGFRIARDP